MMGIDKRLPPKYTLLMVPGNSKPVRLCVRYSQSTWLFLDKVPGYIEKWPRLYIKLGCFTRLFTYQSFRAGMQCVFTVLYSTARENGLGPEQLTDTVDWQSGQRQLKHIQLPAVFVLGFFLCSREIKETSCISVLWMYQPLMINHN